MPKELLFEGEALKALKKGIDYLADAAQVTLGPQGKQVGVHLGFGAPLLTRDGYRVIKEMELKDPYANMGVGIGKEVVSKIKEDFGDGTTTGILLLRALVSYGIESIAAGADALSISRGMEKGVKAVMNEMTRLAIAAKSFEAIERIATVAAFGDKEIGNTVFRALEQAKEVGLVTVEEGQGKKTRVERVEGMWLDQGYVSPYFCTDADKRMAVLSDANILIVDKKIGAVQEILPLMQAMTASKQALVVIAEDFEANVLSTLVMNQLRGILKVCAIKAPGFGKHGKALLEDIAILTGAQVVSKEKGMELKKADQSVLGRAKRVKVTKEGTTIIEGGGQQEAIRERLAYIKAYRVSAEHPSERIFLEERRAKLQGGVVVIRVGAVTELEVRQKKELFENSLNATKAALKGGYVSGGGVALIRASEKIKTLDLSGDEEIGAMIALKACKAPFKALVENCGCDYAAPLESVLAAKGQVGFNALTCEVEDLIAAEVVDPASVVKGCLANALSGAKMVLTSEVLIADAPEETSA